MNPILVKPSKKYRTSFLAAMAELRQDKDSLYEDVGDSLFVIEESFSAYLKSILPNSNISPLINQPLYVKVDTEYWLVGQGLYLGSLTISTYPKGGFNHSDHIGYFIRPTARGLGYGKLILALGLLKVQSLGLQKIRISCRTANLASRKLIETNGGKIVKKIPKNIIQEDYTYFTIDN